MNIQTNFNIGDLCYCLKDNKVEKIIIEDISVSVKGIIKDYGQRIEQGNISVYYFYRDKSTTLQKIEEYLCYETKEDLLRSL